jgi:hypothetical protein
MKDNVECLLHVTGDTAELNAFDKIFRSGLGPQWADRPENTVPRYSFHALFPVPEDVQHRGFDTAGHLWCEDFWESAGDLYGMQVKRVLGERRYHFFTMKSPPQNAVRLTSRQFSNLHFTLISFVPDQEKVESFHYTGGCYSGCISRGEQSFIAKRNEMGFAV